jgi:hypothetical protein
MWATRPRCFEYVLRVAELAALAPTHDDETVMNGPPEIYGEWATRPSAILATGFLTLAPAGF